MDWIFWLKLIITVVAGYLLGSVNTAIIIGKLKGVDIRKKGSGNAGVTNILRTMGSKTAIYVLAGDLLKGVIACLIGRFLIGYVGGIGYLGVLAGGMAAILGHNWPLYFGFKGGRGVLTSLAVMLMMDWRVALIALGIFIIIVAATKYVSLGSILASLALPLFSLIPAFGKSPVFVIFAAAIGILIIARHIPNIKRLISGKEPKLGDKKKEAAKQA